MRVDELKSDPLLPPRTTIKMATPEILFSTSPDDLRGGFLDRDLSPQSTLSLVASSPYLTSSDLADLVVALHDFAPHPGSGNTCLSFGAGQLLRVLNRDPSGWWDGESVRLSRQGLIEEEDNVEEVQGDDGVVRRGNRGWFPSNYVVQAGTAAAESVEMDRVSFPFKVVLSGLVADRTTSMQRPSASSTMSSSAASSRSGSIDPPTPEMEPSSVMGGGGDAFEKTPRPASPSRMLSTPVEHRVEGDPTVASEILDAVLPTLTGLREAAAARRVSQIQPCTATVISSVRTILDASRCLTRESDVLNRHPHLARERRHILAVLTTLVDKTRRASAPGPTDPEVRRADMDAMLYTAERVFAHVQKFLVIAEQSGVTLPDPSTLNFAPPALGGTEEAKATDRPESPGLSRRKELKLAVSQSNLRRAGRKASDASSSGSFVTSQMPNSAPANETSFHPWTQGRPDQEEEEVLSTTSGTSGRWRPSHSVTSSTSSLASSVGPLTPGLGVGVGAAHGVSVARGHVARSTAEVLALVSGVHDRLLSTVAAFIGHVHAHSRTSHPSSYARLIDMTREAIDTVREVLVIVEAVCKHHGISRTKRREVANLTEAKETLYDATTALVTAARLATTAPTAEGLDAEDEEKKALLSSATAVLRTGGECVAAVRVCVERYDGGTDIFEVAASDAPQPLPKHSSDRVEIASTPEEETEDTITWKDSGKLLPPTTSRRSRHTISMLGRKASSLTIIRNQYETTDVESLRPLETPDEEDAQEWLDAPSEPLRSRQPSPSPSAFSNASSSDLPIGRPTSNGSTAMSTTATLTQGTVGASRPAPSRVQSGASTISSHGYARSNAHLSSEPMERDASSHTSTSTSARSRVGSQLSGISTPPSSVSGSPTDSFSQPLRDADDKEWLILDGQDRSGRSSDRPAARSRAQSTASSTFSRTGVSAERPRDWIQSRDYPPEEMSFNSDGNVTGGTLRSLVERMTLHDMPTEATFSNSFFLTFRIFATPETLTAALVARFCLAPPAGLQPTPEQLRAWNEQKVVPVRLRVYNVFKLWLEVYWRPEADNVVLPAISTFARQDMLAVMPSPAQRLIDLVQKRMIAPSSGPRKVLMRKQSTEQFKAGRVDPSGLMLQGFGQGSPLPPTPLISKSLLQNLRNGLYANISVSDFDPMELARQITIMESRIYCAIKPEELLDQEFSKKAGAATNVRAMTALSTRITGWIAETILSEHDARKRTQLVKYFLKLGDVSGLTCLEGEQKLIH